MDYPTTSRSQRKATTITSSPQASSSRQPLSSISESASIRYYTSIANSSTPYESPYAQDRDRLAQPPTSVAIRASTTASTRSPSVDPFYKDQVQSARTPKSSYSSSSSGGSLYPSSPGSQRHRSSTPGTMSSAKNMSSVSRMSIFITVRTQFVTQA